MHFTNQQRFHTRFRLADNVFDSMGQVSLPLDTPREVKPDLVTLDVLNSDIAALLQIDILDCESFTPDMSIIRLSI